MLFTALFAMGSTIPVMASSVTETKTPMPTFSYADSAMNETFKSSNEQTQKALTERKDMLGNTIYGDTFSMLSLEEKLVLVGNYFSAKTDIHKENQKTVLSATDIVQLQELENNLIKESDNVNKDNQLISTLIQEVKAKDMTILTNEEVASTKSLMFKVVESYKSSRSSGKDLSVLIHTQMKVSYSSQLPMLNKFGNKYELSGDKEQALELNKKMLKLTEGDAKLYKKVSNLLLAENKSFFFLDNEVVELTIPFLKKENSTYLDIFDLSNVPKFKVLNEEKQTTISNGDNVLIINKEDGSTQFNGKAIGKNIAIIEDGKLYLPIRSTFELFNYNVESKPEFGGIVIQKQVYGTNEIDLYTAEQLVGGLFPAPKIEENKVESEVKTEVKQESKTDSKDK